MKNLIWALIILAAVSFLFAIITVFVYIPFPNLATEGYSRACSNFALLAIALLLATKK